MKRLFLSLLPLAAAAALHAQDAPSSPALLPLARPEPSLTQRHLSFNEVSKQGTAQVVFLGDSITQGWEGAGKEIWAKTWAPLKAANFGIGGDRTEHVLWRLDHGNYDGLNAKLTVLMIGTNNTGHRMDPAADTAAGIKAIVDKLHAKQPHMKILLLGIFPRAELPSNPQRLRTNEINALLAPLADQKTVFFLDITKSFTQPDGTLSKAIMPDFLHLSPLGYQRWTDAIAPKVTELLAP